MTHPQGSNRGVRVGTVATTTAITIQNSTGSATLQPNSTGLVLDGGLKIKNTTGQIVVNSTSGLKFSGNKVQVGTKNTLFSSNSTGVKLGTKYISGNTTSN